jgi:hypothetical protein
MILKFVVRIDGWPKLKFSDVAGKFQSQELPTECCYRDLLQSFGTEFATELRYRACYRACEMLKSH